MEKEINRIYRNTWITKGCRFIASKRFEKHQNLSNLTITITSIYILFLNLLVLVKDRHEIFSEENITYVTICLSIFVLAISLIVNSKNYQLTSHKFHDCGREISKIYDDSCYYKSNIEIITKEQVKELNTRYQNIIEKYDINQNLLDYNIFKSRNLSDFYTIGEKDKWNQIIHTYLSKCVFWIRTQIHFFFSQYFIYLFIILLPVIIYYFESKSA